MLISARTAQLDRSSTPLSRKINIKLQHLCCRVYMVNLSSKAQWYRSITRPQWCGSPNCIFCIHSECGDHHSQILLILSFPLGRVATQAGPNIKKKLYVYCTVYKQYSSVCIFQRNEILYNVGTYFDGIVCVFILMILFNISVQFWLFHIAIIILIIP